MTARPQSGALTEGWRLLWQTQRVLWWIYAVNLALGFFSGLGFAMRLRGVLNHSLAAQHLYHGFDLAYFIELAVNPEVQFASRPTSSLAFAAIFFIFMLFATGGILDGYARNRMLVPGEFFQGCGAFFWRLVRLLLWLLVLLVPLATLAVGINRWTSRLSDASPGSLDLWVRGAGLVCIAALLMIVRLWFDMAQAGAVVEDERQMTRTLGRAFRLTFSNFFPLFRIYLLPSLLAWAGTAFALIVWVNFVPAERIGWAFLAAQFIAWLWIVTRLWQRASEVIWYQRHCVAASSTTVSMPDASERELPTQALEPQTRIDK